MKINPIIAVLAFICGLGGAIIAYSWSGLSADLATNGTITLIASVLGLLGIYLFNKDYKIAIAQYIVCGVGVLIGTSLLGLAGFLFYIIAAIVAYTEKDKTENHSQFDDENYYMNKTQIKQRYPNFPRTSNNTIFWAVVIISAVLIILAGVLGDASYNNNLQEKANGIHITNVSSDLKVSYGTYTGGVQGTLTSEKDLESVQVKGVWFAADGTQITETYDSGTFNDVKANQKYQLNIPYFEDSSKKPAKVEIRVTERFDTDPIFTQTINFN